MGNDGNRSSKIPSPSGTQERLDDQHASQGIYGRNVDEQSDGITNVRQHVLTPEFPYHFRTKAGR
jgi:hypothetical protein